MRLSIPGLDGVYYDTDARSTALTVALTAAGRRAPKPHGYAVQLVPYLWSFDVDLRELPVDHPLQYLHPEGARALGEDSRDELLRAVGYDLDAAVRLVWAINEEVESGVDRLLGRADDPGLVIEIEDGTVAVEEATASTPTRISPDEPADANARDEPDGTSADADESIEDG